MEASTLEELAGPETGMRYDLAHTGRTQRALDLAVEARSDPPTAKRGMSVQKVEIADICVGDEPGEDAIRLGDDGVECSQALLPSHDVWGGWRPSGNLVRRVELGGQRLD